MAHVPTATIDPIEDVPFTLERLLRATEERLMRSEAELRKVAEIYSAWGSGRPQSPGASRNSLNEIKALGIRLRDVHTGFVMSKSDLDKYFKIFNDIDDIIRRRN